MSLETDDSRSYMKRIVVALLIFVVITFQVACSRDVGVPVGEPLSELILGRLDLVVEIEDYTVERL